MKPIQINRVLFFAETTYDVPQHHDTIATTVRDYKAHAGVDFIVHVFRDKGKIIIFPTGDEIPVIHVYNRPSFLPPFRTLRIEKYEKGDQAEIDYSASRLTDILCELGKVEQVPAEANISRIELEMASHDDFVASMSDDFFDEDGFF